MAVLVERRISPRCDAVQNQSALEFYRSGRSCRARATLLNISREGALISTEETLPLGMSLHFRIESPAKTDWIGVVSVRHDQPHQFGVRFALPCLDDLILAAILGIDLGATVLAGGRPQTFAD
jgi:hypothetical protein